MAYKLVLSDAMRWGCHTAACPVAKVSTSKRTVLSESFETIADAKAYADNDESERAGFVTKAFGWHVCKCCKSTREGNPNMIPKTVRDIAIRHQISVRLDHHGVYTIWDSRDPKGWDRRQYTQTRTGAIARIKRLAGERVKNPLMRRCVRR